MKIFSGSLNKTTEERVSKQINEILEEFAREFPKWYTVSVVKKCKEDANKPENSEMLMELTSPGAEPLKKGTLYKVY
jgi:hypothetical protein